MTARKKKSSTAEVVCRPYCRYYKPGKKEDLACQGFLVIERLLASGKEIPVPMIEETGAAEDAEANLRQELCPVCPFHEDGCDFFAGVERAPACGGFIFLKRLLGKGHLSIDDVRNMG